MTWFQTAVERASCRVRQLLRTGGGPATLTSVVLVVTDDDVERHVGLADVG